MGRSRVESSQITRDELDVHSVVSTAQMTVANNFAGYLYYSMTRFVSAAQFESMGKTPGLSPTWRPCVYV